MNIFYFFLTLQCVMTRQCRHNSIGSGKYNIMRGPRLNPKLPTSPHFKMCEPHPLDYLTKKYICNGSIIQFNSIIYILL